MAELKLVTPMLSNMEVVKKISEHAGTSVYVVKSTKTQTNYILKHISVPESQKQIDALIYSGAASSKEDAQKYYEQVASDYQNELDLLEMLSSSPYIACYRSYQIEPKENEIGYDVYLLSEYRKTLQEVMNENSMTFLSAVNLGLDLCSALSDLRAAELMHRDVKPSNIYLSEQGHFVLGDLGLAKISELKYCSIPEHMISSFSAPELFDLIGSLGLTTDIYAVGLILYRIFNGNHGPFEDERTSARAADKLRVTGQDLPAPMFADYEMSKIILKACAFKPEDRYQTPEELKTELVEYGKRNEIQDTPIVPPIVFDEESMVDAEAEEEEIEPIQFADSEELTEEFKQSFSPDTQMLNSIIDSVHKELEEEEKKQEQSEDVPAEDESEDFEEKKKLRRKRKKRLVPILLGVVAALIAAACLYIFVIEPATIFVEDIALVSKNATSITVQVKSPEASGTFDVICADAYGNSFTSQYVNGDYNRFDSLAPGTAYTISIKSEGAKTVLGNSTLRETTLSETSVLSFTATPVTLTQVEINFTVNGPEPDEWTVLYGWDAASQLEQTFTGHSTVIGNLESDKQYTFTLKDPEGTQLQGDHSAQYATIPTVDIDKISVALSSSKAIISWTIVGDEPEYWQVQYEGEDGSTDSMKVEQPLATLDGLTAGMEYKVTISAPTMLRDGTLTIVPTATSVSNLKAEKQDDGNYLISWQVEDPERTNEWTLHVRPKGAVKESGLSIKLTDDTSYTVDVSKLVPNTTYEVALELATGDILEGDTHSEFTTPASKTYLENGLTGAYIGLYAMPAGDNWTASNLSVPKSSYQPGAQMAFAVEGLGTINTATNETVQICIAIRNDKGLIVDTITYEQPWDSMWQNKLFVGSFPRVPSGAGNYTIEIFINAKLLVTQNFTVQ